MSNKSFGNSGAFNESISDDLYLDDLELTVVTRTVYVHMNDGEKIILENIVECDFKEYAQFADDTGDQFIFPPNSFKVIHMTINLDQSEHQEEQDNE